MCAIFIIIFTQLETWIKEFHTCASFSGRDTDEGVETCVQVSRDSDPSGTDGKELWFTCEGTGVRTVGRAPQVLHIDCSADLGVRHMCANFFCSKAWARARRTTDRDLESRRHEKEIACICTRPTTHHDVRVPFQKKKEKEI